MGAENDLIAFVEDRVWETYRLDSDTTGSQRQGRQPPEFGDFDSEIAIGGLNLFRRHNVADLDEGYSTDGAYPSSTSIL